MIKNILKRLEGLVTNAESDTFLRARFVLTGQYSLILFCILLVISTVVYWLFVIQFGTSVDAVFGEVFEYEIGQSIQHEAGEQLINILLLIDLTLWFFGIVGSYILAGKTLLPIKTMYTRQQQFVADVTHELRTPLAVMRASTEVVLTDESTKTDKTKNFLNSQLDEILKMSDLVNNLLFLLQHGSTITTNYEPVELSALVEKQVESITAYATKNNITISYTKPTELTVLGVSSELERVVCNLLKNAIDYNKEKGNVTIKLFSDDEFVYLNILDTGVGISEEAMPHIFERFYKVDSARQDKEDRGSGLGLSIVKDIINSHEGEINIISKKGEGTEVQVMFPCITS